MLLMLDPSIVYLDMSTGNTALHYLSTEKVLPDYIFMDYSMPAMDGLDCLEKIKKIERAKDIPVVMYSGKDAAHYQDAAMLLGAFTCIDKALDFYVTCENIAALIQHDIEEGHAQAENFKEK
jgi:PleD family two-component response regulator